ncbi:MAG: sigma-54 dependent transcriptional regulator [Rhodospirillales bacterium]|jgi:DNA-binding NtrC family response regulator|nr:sigma-54 dependent transcriptional regulator [Rhodospirillales bacterium]HIJ42500.1 sigma-54-dependent Fis family transcriptional regulator [Rhodospirillaceae bacterium]MDP7097413.1 sigma-54 dependent transcriptional regulator [Rhodospirillales bacterium]HIJ45979.1 sigma-54-dependent Fis family transcriptional regulator [Rhodospirillaceae bacterium]HIJ92725.1 sigma-54-dependent Fis family transcriptional regulator [Rhodospirillaceae bacterium]
MQLLIIGTLAGQIGGASRIAISRGAKVLQADDIEAGLKTLRSGSGVDLVMADATLDIGMLVQSLNSERITVPVVAVGIGNDTQTAVRAIKAGAMEYVPLPPDPDLIAAVLAAVSEESSAIVFKDAGMNELFKLAEHVASSDASIIVTGDSGTGKELMARYLHGKSRRAQKRFVAINCAAIPENLLESELFGYEKGAFTGAVGRRIGKFEEASGGTLLLDEISEMDPRLQAKLLRVIQEREIDRLGGNKPIKVNVRIIATSNRNMEQEVANGNFREDLFFRLNVISLHMPSLRERPEDIGILAEHFVKKYAKANGVEPLPLSAEAKKMLARHPWPGNVRELENAIHRAVLMASGEKIDAAAISLTGFLATGGVAAGGGGPEENASTTESASGLVGSTVAEVERNLIIDTLLHCLGNRTHAANILGISIRTLRNKLKQYHEDGFAVPQAGKSERPAALK